MKRAKHSLSHYRLTTLNQGQLFPVACMEVLPGDSFRQQTAVLLRVSPLVSPVMHPVHVAVHHWFVPNRIMWNNWETFITTANSTALLVPTIDASQCLPIAQAMGIGAVAGVSLPVCALPFRAYNKIYNEFYRDQDLTTPLVESVGDTDVASNYSIKNVSWEKDYFTLCRPYAQQGTNSQVAVLTGQAPVTGIGTRAASAIPAAGVNFVETAGTTFGNTGGSFVWSNENATAVIGVKGPSSGTTPPQIYANLQGASVSMDINEWRRAMAYQRIAEHRNRYGSRYRDYLAFLGVRASDARLQRPEYLGGGKQTISFSEVLSTAETTESKVGDMAGHGIAALRTRTYKRFFEEHGWIISLLYVRPKTVYMNQVPRKFLRRAWSDYWQKELEMMGEQAVQNVEVYGGSTTPNTIFGYMQRHDDYRRHESFVSGEFRNVLDYWHMARSFTSQPVLNGSFIEANPTNRIYASTTNDQLYCMIAHRVSARRLVRKVAQVG